MCGSNVIVCKFSENSLFSTNFDVCKFSDVLQQWSNLMFLQLFLIKTCQNNIAPRFDADKISKETFPREISFLAKNFFSG